MPICHGCATPTGGSPPLRARPARRPGRFPEAAVNSVPSRSKRNAFICGASMTPAVWVGDDCCLCFACTWVLRALTLTHVNFSGSSRSKTRQSRAHARAAGPRVSSQSHVRDHCSRRREICPRGHSRGCLRYLWRCSCRSWALTSIKAATVWSEIISSHKLADRGLHAVPCASHFLLCLHPIEPFRDR